MSSYEYLPPILKLAPRLAVMLVVVVVVVEVETAAVAESVAADAVLGAEISILP